LNTLNFETGRVTYSVNGACEISFNPTDSAFVEKLFNAFNTLDQKQEEYKAEVESMKDKREVFEIARKRDAEMREIIDNVFGPVSKDLFGDMNVYALADGLPVWCNFLLAVMDEIDTKFADERKRTNPRVEKYMHKYRR
jgi:hypothetical protein